MAVAERSARSDGRLARSAGTRTAVVDALLGLMEEGDLRPTAPRIAERAGVSLRSIFQHFPDLESLFAAAADRQTERIRAVARPIPCAGRLSDRVAAFVAQRARLLETISPVRRAALLMEPFSDEVAGRLQQARRAGRREIERVFAAELADRSLVVRRDLLTALAIVSSWSTWEPLRRHQGLSVERARKVVEQMIHALLTGWGS